MRSFSAYAAKLGNWLHRLKSNYKTMTELRSCSGNDLHRVARDVGLNEEGLARLAVSHQGPTVLMPQRLERLQLHPDYVQLAYPATFRDLQLVCASCTASERCARDLAAGDVETGMRDYCLNAPTIDALLVEPAKASP
jgi:hypothetical protein